MNARVTLIREPHADGRIAPRALKCNSCGTIWRVGAPMPLVCVPHLFDLSVEDTEIIKKWCG